VKYTIHYGRKMRISESSMIEVALRAEYDDSITPFEIGFKLTRDKVKAWIKEEAGKISSVSKPLEKNKIEISKQEMPRAITIESVSKAFPQELKSKLYFEDSGNYILVKALKYLGSETFKKVADIVKGQLGGEYISAGQDSHFRIRKAVG